MIARGQKTGEEVEFKVDTISVENLSDDKFSNCTIKTSIKLEKTIRDLNQNYSFNIPENWIIEENILDNVNGMVISKDSLSLYAIGIVEITNDTLTLDHFFQNEFLRTMVDKTEVKMIDAGTANINGIDSYWIFQKSELDGDNLWTYLYYTQNIKNNNFYLINTSTFGNRNDLDTHCSLRQIVNTFRFIE